MPLSFQCACGKAYSVAEDRAGQELLCSGCGKILRIPAEGAPPAEPPPGAAAPRPPSASWWPCPTCGAKIPRWESLCLRCAAGGADPPASRVSPPPPRQDAVRAPDEVAIPWERRERLGFWQAAWDTVLLLLLHPAKGFSAPGLAADLGPPLLFYAVFGIGFGLIGSTLDTLVLTLLAPYEELPQFGPFVLVGIPFTLAATAGYLVVMPFLSAGLTHLGLMAGGARHREYAATLTVLLYAYAATAPLHLVPVLGIAVELVWFLVIYIAGLAQVHRCGVGKAVVAVLVWPFLLCCCLALLVLFVPGCRLRAG